MMYVCYSWSGLRNGQKRKIVKVSGKCNDDPLIFGKRLIFSTWLRPDNINYKAKEGDENNINENNY